MLNLTSFASGLLNGQTKQFWDVSCNLFENVFRFLKDIEQWFD